MIDIISLFRNLLQSEQQLCSELGTPTRPSCLLPSIPFSQLCVTEDFLIIFLSDQLKEFFRYFAKITPRWWKIHRPNRDQSECLWRPKSFYQSASTTHEAGKTGKTNEHQTASITRCVWTHWSILVLPRILLWTDTKAGMFSKRRQC